MVISEIEFRENLFVEGVYNATLVFGNGNTVIVSTGEGPISEYWDDRRPYHLTWIAIRGEANSSVFPDELANTGQLSFLTEEELETVLSDIEAL